MQVILCHNQTFDQVHALYQSRQHTRQLALYTALVLPSCADLGPTVGRGRMLVRLFITGLPGFSQLSLWARHYSLNTGYLRVCLVRLLSRYFIIIIIE